MSDALTRDSILQSNDLKTEQVKIPEWNGSVFVRTMSGWERDEFEASIGDARKNGRLDIRGLKARLVTLTAVDESGKLLFAAGDVEALQRKSAKAIERIFQKAQELNGLGDESVDELLGNSEGAPNA